MKNRVYRGVRILTFVVFCILLSGCIGKDERLKVSPSKLTFSKDGGSASMEISFGEIESLDETGADFITSTTLDGHHEFDENNICVKASLDWLEVVRVSYKNYSVEAKPNDSGKERYALIVFWNADSYGSAKITQKAE